MKTHNNLSKWQKLYYFFFGKTYGFKYIMVPVYTLQYYFRKMNILSNEVNDYREQVNRILDNWRKTNDEWEQTIDLVNIYKSVNKSYQKTIDSLIGELIMKGATEKEINQMFDKVVSYKKFIELKN